jgi:2-phosphosulfolactate phosphatase
VIPQARAILSGATLERVLEGQRDRGLPPPDAAVVVDVLRATTTLVHAFAHGAAAVRAFAHPDEAHRAGGTLPKGSTLLCGERGGVRLPGFDLGNSPREYVSDFVRGRTLLFCTSNGTKVFRRTREARRQMAAAFVNAGAVVRRLRGLAAEAAHPPTIPGGDPDPPAQPFEAWIIAAGEADQASLEDTACVLSLLESLGASDPPFAVGVEPGDEAVVEAVRAAGATHFADDDQLLAFLSDTAHGRALVQTDFLFARDIRDAARRDQFDVVPEGRGGTLDAVARMGSALT